MSASKFTADVAATVVARLAAGASLPDAARDAGVRLNTLKSWLQRGRREDLGVYAAFARDVDEARDAAARRAVGEMTAGEFRAHVEHAVRNGSVQAMRLWADRFLVAADTPADERPVSAITRLARGEAS